MVGFVLWPGAKIRLSSDYTQIRVDPQPPMKAITDANNDDDDDGDDDDDDEDGDADDGTRDRQEQTEKRKQKRLEWDAY